MHSKSIRWNPIQITFGRIALTHAQLNWSLRCLTNNNNKNMVILNLVAEYTAKKNIQQFANLNSTELFILRSNNEPNINKFINYGDAS